MGKVRPVKRATPFWGATVILEGGVTPLGDLTTVRLIWGVWVVLMLPNLSRAATSTVKGPAAEAPFGGSRVNCKWVAAAAETVNALEVTGARPLVLAFRVYVPAMLVLNLGNVAMPFFAVALKLPLVVGPVAMVSVTLARLLVMAWPYWSST